MLIIKMKYDNSSLENGFKFWCIKRFKNIEIKFFESRKFTFFEVIEIIDVKKLISEEERLEIINKFNEFQITETLTDES